MINRRATGGDADTRPPPVPSTGMAKLEIDVVSRSTCSGGVPVSNATNSSPPKRPMTAMSDSCSRRVDTIRAVPRLRLSGPSCR